MRAKYELSFNKPALELVHCVYRGGEGGGGGHGTMTFSIKTFSIKTLKIKGLCTTFTIKTLSIKSLFETFSIITLLNAEWHFADCHNFFMPNVIILSAV